MVIEEIIQQVAIVKAAQPFNKRPYPKTTVELTKKILSEPSLASAKRTYPKTIFDLSLSEPSLTSEADVHLVSQFKFL